jgi:hypothetical protein
MGYLLISREPFRMQLQAVPLSLSAKPLLSPFDRV